MGKKIISAGIIYFYLRGIWEENDQISVYTQDTYKCLPEEFYDRACSTFFDEDGDSIEIHMLGVIGIPNKIHMIEDIVNKGLQNNCQRIVDGRNVIKSSAYLDKVGNVYFRLIQEFVCEMPDHFPYAYNKDSNKLSLSCVWSSNASEEIARSLADSVIDIWLEKETPVMAGKQIINRSFFMSDFVGKKSIACIPNMSTGERILLFEGGNALALDTGSFYKGVSSPNALGFFSVSGINNIPYFWNISNSLFPLRYPMNPETLIFGVILTSICMWSGHTSPSIISTPFHWQSWRSISRISNLFSAKNTFRLYFGAKTIWYLQFQLVCAKLLLSMGTFFIDKSSKYVF